MCALVLLLVCCHLQKRFHFHRISKTPEQKCVSGHSEQLLIFGLLPPKWETTKFGLMQILDLNHSLVSRKHSLTWNWLCWNKAAPLIYSCTISQWPISVWFMAILPEFPNDLIKWGNKINPGHVQSIICSLQLDYMPQHGWICFHLWPKLVSHLLLPALLHRQTLLPVLEKSLSRLCQSTSPKGGYRSVVMLAMGQIGWMNLGSRLRSWVLNQETRCVGGKFTSCNVNSLTQLD